MKKFILFISLFQCLWIFAQSPVDNPRWKLLWQDNFDTLNTDIWKIQDNFDHYGSAEVAVKENVYVEGGSLICEVKKETYSCPSWAVEPNWFCVNQYKSGNPYSYTMAWVESKEAYYIKYGYIEASMYISYQPGICAAFWTFLGNDIAGTNAAEIDIIELLGELGNRVLTTNLHRNHEDSFQKHSPNGYSWDGWHKYAIEWSPDKIIWYIDDSPIRVVENHGIVDSVKLIFDIGTRPGVSLETTDFPQKMYVDYVRVYRLDND